MSTTTIDLRKSEDPSRSALMRSYDEFSEIDLSDEVQLDNGTSVHFESLGNLSFTHKGRNYHIDFIKQRTGADGEETEMDLTYFTNYAGLSESQIKLRKDELNAFIEQAKKMIDLMGDLKDQPGDFANSKSFSFNFTQRHSSPSLLNKMSEKVGIKKWTWTPEPDMLESISYGDSKETQTRKFDIKLGKYDAPAQNEILQTTHALNLTIRKTVQASLEQQKPHRFERTAPIVPPTNPSINMTHLNEDNPSSRIVEVDSDEEEPLDQK